MIVFESYHEYLAQTKNNNLTGSFRGLSNMKKIFTILVLLVGSVLGGYAATYTVTNTNDSGAGSLRQAIIDANASVGADIINFNIPGGGTFTISPTSALPAISDGVTIDGLSQPGANAGSPKIVLSGSSAGANVNGLTISTGANNSVIKGLVINGFTGNGISIASNNSSVVSCLIGLHDSGGYAVPNGLAGVSITAGTNNTIGGSTTADRNFISGNRGAGIDISGTATGNIIKGNYVGLSNTPGNYYPVANGLSGVSITSANNIIGGSAAGEGNLISGNTLSGVSISGNAATGNILKGNYIGTNESGSGTLANGNDGVTITSANNIIGGSAAGERNLISGNRQSGVSISGSSATGNILKGNYIGTNASGSGRVANNNNGITITSANNIIGGSAPGEGNLISANDQSGVFISGSGATGNVLKGNYIGTDAVGTGRLNNNSTGVSITGSNNTVGGVGSGEGNIIAFNNTAGVWVQSSSPNATGNSIRGNSITENNGLGIDLGNIGVNANDAGDADMGANDLQNFPVITAAYKNAIVGTLNSTPNSTFTLDFYSNTTADASGNGEGKVYLGSTTVTTDGSGNTTYSFAGTFTAGTIISATAGNAGGSTSEFAANQTVQDALPVSLLSFKATATSNNRQALLEWITSVEINNDRFEVERSANALDWKKLSTLSGKGNNSETAYYQFIDESPLLATNYYRLKQIDFDGTHTYSQIKALSFEEELSSALTAYPNPTNGTVTITLNELIEVQRVGLYNLSGNKLSGSTQSISPNKISVDLSNLPTGTYLVNYGNKSVKVMRQ